MLPFFFSIFNRILVFLAVFDNIFIFCSILEAIRKHFGPLHDVIHVYAFAYFLYQLQSMAIVSSIFTTVVLAVERCLAVAKPIEYHNAIQGFINTSLKNKTFLPRLNFIVKRIQHIWTPDPLGPLDTLVVCKGPIMHGVQVCQRVRGPIAQSFIVPSSSGVQMSQGSKWARGSIVLDSLNLVLFDFSL